MIGDTNVIRKRTVIDMGEIRQTNFRIDQDTADAFRKWCEEHNWNQAEGFDNVMRQVELNKAKATTPGRAVEIESFEKSVKDIMAAYLNSIEINNNAESRIREQFASSLDSKDKTISDLQEKMATLQEAKTTAEQTATSAAQMAAQAVKDAETAKEQSETSNKLAEERSRTIANLADKLSVAEEKAASFDDLKKSEEQKQITIEKLQNDIESAKTAHDKELEDLKKDHQREIDDLNKSHQSAITEYDRKIETLNKDHEAALKNLQNELDRKVADKDKEIEVLAKDHETALRELKSEMERKISDTQKDADLALERAVSQKEREMTSQIRDLEKDNSKLQTRIEILEERIKELTTTPQQ